MYQGYFIKLNNTVIPASYMRIDSYQCTYETLDFDSFRDANGMLHRTALPDRKVKVEFETPYLYANQMESLMSIIRSNFTDVTEQAVQLTAYLPETDDYVTQKAYLVNTTFKISQNSRWGYVYSPTRICFIAY